MCSLHWRLEKIVEGIRVRGRSADADGIHDASQYQL